MEKLTDKFLWKALKEGDLNAFSVLFESYYPDLHSYGLKISKNTALTEDTCITSTKSELVITLI